MELSPGTIVKVELEYETVKAKIIKNLGKNAWDAFTEDNIEIEILEGMYKGDMSSVWESYIIEIIEEN